MKCQCMHSDGLMGCLEHQWRGYIANTQNMKLYTVNDKTEKKTFVIYWVHSSSYNVAMRENFCIFLNKNKSSFHVLTFVVY